MKENDCYLAGVVDGEGHIDFRLHKNGRGESHYYPRIIIVQKDRRLTDWLKNIFGGSSYFVKNNTGGYFRWEIKGRAVEKIVKHIYPYLLVKREQAERVIRGIV